MPLDHVERWLLNEVVKNNMTDIKVTLNERGKEYGDYGAMCTEIQRLKNLFRAAPSWNAMTDTERETLDSMALKMGRILAGNPHYPDSWVDLAGYATKMAEQLAPATTSVPVLPERLLSAVWEREGHPAWTLSFVSPTELDQISSRIGSGGIWADPPVVCDHGDGVVEVFPADPPGKVVLVFQRGSARNTRRLREWRKPT